MGCLNGFGRDAAQESWAFFVLNHKFPLGAEGRESVAQPAAAC